MTTVVSSYHSVESPDGCSGQLSYRPGAAAPNDQDSNPDPSHPVRAFEKYSVVAAWKSRGYSGRRGVERRI